MRPSRADRLYLPGVVIDRPVGHLLDNHQLFSPVRVLDVDLADTASRARVHILRARKRRTIPIPLERRTDHRHFFGESHALATRAGSRRQADTARPASTASISTCSDFSDSPRS